MLALWAFLAWTPYGRILRAGSRDPEMVELLGINLPRVLTAVFGLGCALAAIAGVLAAPCVDGVAVDVGQRSDAGLRGGGDRRPRLVPRRGGRRPRGRHRHLADHQFKPEAAAASMYVLMFAIMLLRPRGLFGERLGALRMKAGPSMIQRLWNHPIVVMTVVLIAASGIALVFGMPIHRVTQIAIYTLYVAGVNFLIGYLGLVPFGASFFFGCASYALAILGNMVPHGNEITA